MKGLITGCGEIGKKERTNIQVFFGVGGYIHRREH
jgi:hypothetical protein